MRFIIIGLGSMGKRRIRLLQEYFKSINEPKAGTWEICGVDNRKDRCLEVEQKFKIETEKSIEEALLHFKPDVALICSSPLSHASIISECLNAGLHVFTEINVVSDGYEKNIRLAKKKEVVLFLSSTPMYRREMQFIKKWIQEKNYKVSYRYQVGQYLPEWHPWENYKDFFVNDKRTNGCRELFAIELPWMMDALGEIESYHSQHCKLTGLQIDYDDTYQVMIKHSTGIIGCLMVDVVTPHAGRCIEVFGEGSYLVWGGTPDSLKVMEESKELKTVNLYDDTQHEAGYEKFVIEDAYFEELKAFIECIENGRKLDYSFKQDKEILKIIDGIEQ